MYTDGFDSAAPGGANGWPLQRIPMVAPFFGCLLGGFIYDAFLYTGESPINTPWMGLKRLTQPRRDVWSNTYQRKEISNV
ncbi:uncharacterized protein PgNI_12065 [Pyricularia grisea]|uniref:Uncharacterized protein n=1 Tax=Pyricularia grisea TaxID=148305 RepID=A0A6P8AQZ8_PYRGI|nr:uncharacterized protein PgNI_12065 [Pyricularia grisea]TLD04468.1 hypothetical protein PgNI_12065 [Pyricularia grisea]